MSVELLVIFGLLAHEVGDYCVQSDWMAQNKTKSWVAAITHAFTYTLCFTLFFRHPIGLFFIFITHLVIDHYRLARFVCWAKNFLAPKWIDAPAGHICPNYYRNYPWRECEGTGYHHSLPPFLAVWLMIRTDNTMHKICNTAAIVICTSYM